MNHCDHNHETRGEIRALPTGRDRWQGNMLICQTHYFAEMDYRRSRARETGIDKWQFPPWTDLEVVYQEVRP